MVIDSPLLFPVYRDKNKIYVLDETALPFQERYIEVEEPAQALWVLKSMKTRSLGQVLLFFYSCLVFEDQYTITEIVSEFQKARPTFDFHLLGAILKDEMERFNNLQKAIDHFIGYFDESRKKRAKDLAKILPDPASILTICNFNGELIYLYEELRNLNKKANFVVCETRPYLQGTRLTFWELKKNHIPCQLVCDNQSAQLMRKGQVNCLITGADRATKNGDIVNKIGTYPLARLAEYYNIPFYPLIQYPNDMHIEDVIIEERPKDEVFMFLSNRFMTNQFRASVEAIYPSFDITISNFVTKCIELPA